MNREVAPAPSTPGLPESCHWEAATWDEGHHVHVVPVDDLIVHYEDHDGGCPCGPTVEMQGEGWLITHHSLDNREAVEAALEAEPDA